MQIYNNSSKNITSFLFYRNTFTFLLFAVLILVVYSNSFKASWQFDDYKNITKNPSIHLEILSFDSLIKTFYAHPYQHIKSEKEAEKFETKLYRPLSMLTFAINWFIGKDNVIGYHIVNYFIHLTTSFFLFLTILHLFKTPQLKNTSSQDDIYFIAILASILWAINPIQVQAVTYIVQRMASLAGMFYIIALYCYLKARISNSFFRSLIFYSGVALSFFMAFVSKQNSILLPLSIILVELCFFQSFEVIEVLKKKKMALIVMIFLVLCLLSIIFFCWKDPLQMLQSYEKRGFSLKERLLTQPRILFFYLSQIFYPIETRFSIDHYIQLSYSFFSPLSTALSTFGIGGLLTFSTLFLRRMVVISFAILFFFINHAVESTIFPLELIFEHRNYIPSFFIFVPVALYFKKAVDEYETKNKIMAAFLICSCISLIIFTGFSTYTRNLAWRSPYTLWTDVMKKSPQNARPYQNLSISYDLIKNYKKVVELNQKALGLKDSTPKKAAFISYHNMAKAYLRMKQYEKAGYYFEKASEIVPLDENNNILFISLLLSMGNLDKANQKINSLLSTRSYNEDTVLWLKALSLLHQNEYEKAVEYGLKAVRFKPTDEKSLLILATAHSNIGQYKQAEYLLNQTYLNHSFSITTNFSILNYYLMHNKVNQADQIAANILKNFTYAQITEHIRILKEGNLFYPPVNGDRILDYLYDYILKES